MSRPLTFLYTLLAMIAFAGNSLLCRLALRHTAIDAASFTSIRIVSGALALWLILRFRGGDRGVAGSWLSALALFAYAACFSFAYISLPAATGALLLFGAVQATMIGYGFWIGERLRIVQLLGLCCASAGLLGLMLPGAMLPDLTLSAATSPALATPPLPASLLMIAAGFAWGIYSLRGKGVADPITATTGNFLRAAPFAIALGALALPWASLDRAGACYAIASGALTSGVGYAVWYTALRGLKATSAAVVQLSVPVFAAIGGIVFLGEAVSLRLLVASVAILGGIGLVIVEMKVERATR